MILFKNGGASILGIQMYAICILVGIIVAVYAGIKEAKKLGIWSDFVYYGVLLCVPISIIGARTWYVLFNLSDFDSFAEVLGFQGGSFVGLSGLAIQGAVIVTLITIFFYCKRHHVSLYIVLDFVAPSFLIGQIFGRWGNFFNNELYGPIVKNVGLFKTLLPSFIVENMHINNYYRHPTFLYESMLNLVGLILMFVIRRKSKKMESGDLMCGYLVWYGFVRIFTESLRSKSGAGEILMLGKIPVSILFSVIFIVCGVLFFILKRTIKKLPKREKYMDIINRVKQEKIDTVIFDLDGTLLDTKTLIDHSFIYTFQHFFPTKELCDEELDSFFGPTLYETFSKYEKDDVKINEMISYYRTYNKEHHQEFVKPFDTVKETLRGLSRKGYQLGVVSSKSKDMIIYGLDEFDLTKYFDCIVGGDEVENPKPNPEGILKAVQHFKNVNKVLYVGDNASDIQAGINANVKTCGVMYSKDFDAMDKLNPNYYILKMDGLFKILCE